MVKLGFVLALVPLLSLSAQRCRDCGPEDTIPRTHVLPAFGLHVGVPEKASITAGVVIGEDWQSEGRDRSRNVALLAEPGLNAGRLSVAYVRHGYGNFGSGFGVAGTAMRTWNRPWSARPNVTYAGGDVFLWPVLFVGPRVGLFRSVAGNSTDRRWLLALDFGVGF